MGGAQRVPAPVGGAPSRSPPDLSLSFSLSGSRRNEEGTKKEKTEEEGGRRDEGGGRRKGGLHLPCYLSLSTASDDLASLVRAESDDEEKTEEEGGRRKRREERKEGDRVVGDEGGEVVGGASGCGRRLSSSRFTPCRPERCPDPNKETEGTKKEKIEEGGRREHRRGRKATGSSGTREARSWAVLVVVGGGLLFFLCSDATRPLRRGSGPKVTCLHPQVPPNPPRRSAATPSPSHWPPPPSLPSSFFPLSLSSDSSPSLTPTPTPTSTSI